MTDVSQILALHKQNMPEALIAAECLCSLQRVRSVIAEHGSSVPHPRKTRPPSPPRSGRVKLAGACSPQKRAPAISPDPFGLAILPHLVRLKRYALSLTRNRSEAEEIVQDVFARALEKQHLFQPGTDLCAWLMTCLHHRYVSHVKVGIRRAEAERDIAHFGEQAARPPQYAAMLWQTVLAALERMPAEHRIVLLLAADGIQREKIAQTLGVPIGTVRSRLSRGRDKLHELIEGDETRRPPLKRSTAPPLHTAA